MTLIIAEEAEAIRLLIEPSSWGALLVDDNDKLALAEDARVNIGLGGRCFNLSLFSVQLCGLLIIRERPYFRPVAVSVLGLEGFNVSLLFGTGLAGFVGLSGGLLAGGFDALGLRSLGGLGSIGLVIITPFVDFSELPLVCFRTILATLLTRFESSSSSSLLSSSLLDESLSELSLSELLVSQQLSDESDRLGRGDISLILTSSESLRNVTFLRFLFRFDLVSVVLSCLVSDVDSSFAFFLPVGPTIK